MRTLIYFLILFPLISFSQDISKSEFKKLIKERIKVVNADGVSYSDLRLFADNTDSLFFKTNKFTIYVDRGEKYQKYICRKVEFDFLNLNEVIFTDTQTCKEPANSYFTTEYKRFRYKVFKEQKKLYVEFENKFSKRRYRVIDTVRNNKRITSFTLIDI